MNFSQREAFNLYPVDDAFLTEQLHAICYQYTTMAEAGSELGRGSVGVSCIKYVDVCCNHYWNNDHYWNNYFNRGWECIFKKLNSPSPTIEKTATTEITFTIEIVMSSVLFFKWITHVNYIEIITDFCLYLYAQYTITLKPID